MNEAILTFQFSLNQKESGEIEPTFNPIKLIFKNENFNEKQYQEIISSNDIFSIYYNQTTGAIGKNFGYDNLYYGRLKDTSYKVVSYFLEVSKNMQYLAILLFQINEEISIYTEVFNELVLKLKLFFTALEKANRTNQTAIVANIFNQLTLVLKYAHFQLNRLASLEKVQKAALIFNSPERILILNSLREGPISKKELKRKIDKINHNTNIDSLLEPFLELNIVRRDWIESKGEKKRQSKQSQGEYLFLIKDITLTRVPNIKLLEHLKESKNDFFQKFERKSIEFFSTYHPNKQTIEDIKIISTILLNPDLYDNFIMLRNKYYPLDKMPKISSEFTNSSQIIKKFLDLNIIIDLKDKDDRSWIFLLSDLKPLVFFPEYLLTKIRDAYNSKEKEIKISFEVAKKAHELLELTFPEKIEF